MNKLRLSRLISDGMIFQRDKKIHIYGWETEDTRVTVEIYHVLCKNDVHKTAEFIEDSIADISCISVNKETASGLCTDGTSGEADLHEYSYRFDVFLSPLEAGGPFIINVISGDICITIEDVYSGDVFQLAGQSNIELPMSRVRESYPEAFENPCDPLLRTFKVSECGNFHGPISDVKTGSWISVTKESLPDFSALGFFFANALRQSKKVPIGIINTTLGGSTIESWMSHEMLTDFPDLLALENQYSNDYFVKEQLEKNLKNTNGWNEKCIKNDLGTKEKWYKTFVINNNAWKDISLPVIFKDLPELKGFTGCIWLKKHFNLSASMIGKSAHIWFGTMTDSDIFYINGSEIGSTPYKYPPRRYTVPEGLLKEGDNDITIRLTVQGGTGYVTPGKVLCLFTGNAIRSTDGCNEYIADVDNFTDLSGDWKYRIGCTMDHVEPTDFVNWKPTALFNGMLHPCTNYPIKAVIWYQGESNVGREHIYKNQFRHMVDGYRKLWNDSRLPVLFIKLPEFDNSTYEPDDNYTIKDDWARMQKIQEDSFDIPDTYMIESAGTGEINDLHPQRKKPLGESLAAVVMRLNE